MMDMKRMAEWLAQARLAFASGDDTMLRAAFVELDRGEVFKTLDAFTGYALPEDVLDQAAQWARERVETPKADRLPQWAADSSGGAGIAATATYQERAHLADPTLAARLQADQDERSYRPWWREGHGPAVRKGDEAPKD